MIGATADKKDLEIARLRQQIVDLKQSKKEEEKGNRILDAATKIFANSGFNLATIADVAIESEVAASTIYLHFTNKLDLLISIYIRFWQNINTKLLKELLTTNDPREKLKICLTTIEKHLSGDKKSLLLARVLNETVPDIMSIKEKDVQDKRKELEAENKIFLETISQILVEGQDRGVFDKSIKVGAMIQILYGSVQMLIHGFYLKIHHKVKIGYEKKDAEYAVNRLIEKFLCVDEK